MSATLTLGVFTFTNFNVPQRINGAGGSQDLSIKQLVGGQRIIDVMGGNESDLAWDGLFFGTTAEEDVILLKSLRSAGLPLPLIYSSFLYLVVIKDFVVTPRRPWEIEYKITCAVIQDLTNPISDLSFLSYNDVINSLQGAANTLSSTIGNSNISNAMVSVNSSINAIPSLQNATPAELSTVETPTQNAISVVSTETSILNSSTFSPTTPLTNDELATNISILSDMYSLNSILTQILNNITLIDQGSTGQTIVVNGASLFKLAARYYGNATLWTTIANANNLKDPHIPAGNPLSLVIPSTSSDTGGILNG